MCSKMSQVFILISYGTLMTVSIFNGTEYYSGIAVTSDKLAALWPFLGICAEVAILCIIIFVYEKRRSKQMDEDDAPEKEHMTNSHDHKGTDDVRHRK